MRRGYDEAGSGAAEPHSSDDTAPATELLSLRPAVQLLTRRSEFGMPNSGRRLLTGAGADPADTVYFSMPKSLST